MGSCFSKQVGGDHYLKMSIQPAQYAYANNLGFLEGSIVKYVSRHHRKGGRADLEKAKHYIEMLIELEYADEKGVEEECLC